ncbi:MAG: SusC/RagA family TonB-linked outer membrane protein [Bacteroidetes bacterium]|jgi:TonB-dependent starch-binding outer membrane protein SusC|nr:SusC/RagA family TonB-linked outer membrane protein [Bacteroidota bacterium]
MYNKRNIEISRQNSLFSLLQINRKLLLTGLLFLLANFCFVPLFAQNKSISGTVLDTAGEPVIGANIQVKGTVIGSITDLEGHFSFQAPQRGTLVISYVGYKTQEIALGKPSYKITLEEDFATLDEVVVVGYGTAKKSDLTGAVMSANIKDFEKSPNTNIMQSLQGSVPGLNIGQVTSAGSTPSISIRGKNTISGNTSVLIVLDGIIYGNELSSINPADIESIDILKDASATAVYGAQAANGVMLITTKKGKSGKAKVNFTSSYTIQNPTHNYSTMNRSQYLTFLRNLMWSKEYTKDSGYTEKDESFNLADYLPETYMTDDEKNISETDFNWWDTCTRQASIFDNHLTISGGTDALSYLVSYGNVSQENFLLNDNFKRNSVRVNLDAKVRSWWKLGVQVSGSFVNQDGAEPTLWTLYSMNPLATAYNTDGSIKSAPMEMARANPLLGSNITDKERHNYFIGNVYSEIQLPLKGLTYRINWGNDYTINTHNQTNPYGNSETGEAYKTFSSSYNYTVDNIVNYARDFGLHSIGATLVYGIRENNYSYTKADATEFSNLTLGYNSLELGTNQFTTSDANDASFLYQMARVNYKYNNRYLLTATVRRDGFSGFAANHKTAIFPSIALGWVISDESFFKVPVINYLKLRGGYGVSGNLTKSYSSLAKVTTSSGYVFKDDGTAVIREELSSMENKDLKWETTGGYNFGVDFRLLKDRIQGSLEMYKTTTTNLLYDVSIPTITGFSSITSNVGKISNKGIELTVTSRNIVTKDFEWSTTFNISSNKNKVLELTGKGDLISSGLFIGKSLSAVYGYKIDGIYQASDDVPSGYYIGNYKIHDETGEGSITTDDRTILGKTDPAYRFSIMNKFTYKDFSLSFFVNSVQGGKDGYLGENTYTLIQDNTARACNHLNEFSKHVWSIENPGGIYSASTATASIVPIRYEDRSFIRLQDVSLGYNLPKKLIQPIGIDNVNIYVAGKNLLTITKWHGWDPEANYGTVTPIGRNSSTTIDKSGSDYDSRPVMRGFTMGINVSF